MALDGLEWLLADRYVHRSWNRNKVNMVRHVDDVIITGVSREVLEHEVIPLVVDFLANRDLKLSKEKNRITPIGVGFAFVG